MIFRDYFRLGFLVLLAFVFVGAGVAHGYTHKVYPLPSSIVGKYIASTKGQKRVVMIYASWCPHCVEAMPDIMDIERAKPGSVIAISVDEDHAGFARYIERFKDVPFKIIINGSPKTELAAVLTSFGGRAWSGVPTYYLVDENNQIVDQGTYGVDYIATYLLQ
ncbi:MAG: redoxin family protein [Alphaproteobacteria bacterium]|nr:redoxin family protein [Alphaproteobacteria bacterium]